MPLDERLARYILEGSKDGLVDDLDEALTTRGPLEIINGPLMKGMDEVGRLFNANQMIVAEVLQSAEAMKAAVAHLEPHMEKIRERHQGQDHSRDRQGRRSRHRQKPGRDHSQQQRLPGRQSRHQGAARGTDQGVSRASPRRDRAVGPAGQVGADDGRHGAGLENRGHRLPDPGRRRRALEPLHADENRARVRGPGRIRQRRDERARPRQSDHGLRAARIAQARARRAIEEDARGRAEVVDAPADAAPRTSSVRRDVEIPQAARSEDYT